MRQDITTIPISDVFEPRQGCPLCRMHQMLEDRLVEYITGAAMMEPDVRIETNRQGFCGHHFGLIRERGNRLSVALILESHLKELQEKLFPTGSVPGKRELHAAKEQLSSCFLCSSIENNTDHLLETLYALWGADEAFRTLYQSQEYVCLPHYTRLMEGAKKVPRAQRAAFCECTAHLACNYLNTLQQDITHFCSMFDYRNKTGDWNGSQTAIERSIAFLTAQPQKEEP